MKKKVEIEKIELHLEMSTKNKQKNTKIVMGNWKMNPATFDEAKRILSTIRKAIP